MKVYNNPLWVGISLVLIIAVICLTFKLRTVWWSYIDIFFFFMASFLQLMAVTLGKRLPQVGAKMNMLALGGVLTGILALVAEAIAWNIIM